MPAAAPTTANLHDDVIDLVVNLIRIDTTNPGNHSGPGEIRAAEYAAAALSDVGIEAQVFTTTAPHRAGVAAFIQGTDISRPPLLLTGHLDVVPAPPDGWTHPPFSGHIDDDGVIWGRGAVDMKDMVGMELAILRSWAREGYTPERSIALLLTPDEEAGGAHGAQWIVAHRPELLHGATEAIGEVGGFSATLPNGRRIYPIQAEEKGLAWITARLKGTAGHGSLIHHDNPVARLLHGVAALAEAPFGVELTPAMTTFVETVSELIGEPLDLSDIDHLTAQLGGVARVVGAATRTTLNPTMLEAGFKHNVVPGEACIGMDLRYLPGEEAASLDLIRAALPAETELAFAHRDIAVQTPFEGHLVDTMIDVLHHHDPEGVVVPYLMTGGTDGKAFSTLGVRYFGFSPLSLPADMAFWGMFHAVDERVTVEALHFGVDVLDDVLRCA